MNTKIILTGTIYAIAKKQFDKQETVYFELMRRR
jgi:hypothetical protein